MANEYERLIKTWTVKFSSQSRIDDTEYNRTLYIKAASRIEAEDIGLRKCRLIGYKNYKVSAE